MSCQHLANRIDAFLDGDIPEGERAALEAHVHDCADCSALLARENRRQRLMKAQPVPEPTPDVFDRMLEAAGERATRERQSWRMKKAVGGALAAGLIAWSLVSVFNRSSLPTPAPLQAQAPAPVASVTMTLQETRTIRLVFASPDDLNDAKLSLVLPPGVELAGHDGEQQVRWKTNLQRGKNVLPLKLVVREGAGGELLARLEHGDRQKTFRVRVVVRPDRDQASLTLRSSNV